MIVFVAEKPSLGFDLAKALFKKFDKKNGAIINADQSAVVTWLVGHVYGYAPPEHYAPGDWKSVNLPIIPDKFVLLPKEKAKDQIAIAAKWCQKASKIVHVGDAGREGQILVDEFLIANGIDPFAPHVFRLWLNDQTPEGIRQAYRKMKPNATYRGLSQAGEERMQADWLIGMNATRAMTLSAGGSTLLSIGRVQTPTLALIVNRDREIENFVPKQHYQLWANGNGLRFRHVPKEEICDPQGLVLNRSPLDTLAQKFPAVGTVQEAQVREQKESAPLPFTLAELQKRMNSKYGWNAKKTLDVAQSLYERHKLTTYPRTSFPYLEEARLADAPRILDALSPFFGEQVKLADPNKKPHSRAFDDRKIGEHTGIIPTGKTGAIQDLSADEKLLFKEIALRYIAQFYPDAVYLVGKIEVTALDERFVCNDKKLITPGWMALYDKEPDADRSVLKAMQTLNKGDTITLTDPEIEEKMTTPPPHFTEATLIAAMVNIARFIEDEEAKKILKETDGLGTEATRAEIIDILKRRGYIEEKNKSLVSTELGRFLVDQASPHFTNAITTAIWERKLDEMSKNSNVHLTPEIIEFVKTIIPQIMAQPKKLNHTVGKNVLGQCPVCKQGEIIEGKKGYGCSRYREGCQFVIWKEIAGKKLSASVAKQLIQKGYTKKLQGFKSKKGTTFDAALEIKDGKVSFMFY